MAGHGKVYRSGDSPPTSSFYDQGKFGRLFGNLPPFAADTPSKRAALKELGKQGGLMDAMDQLTAHPRDLITDANLSLNNSDNPDMPAGMTFLGQFLDHDLTLDITSSLEQQVDPELIQNFRTPAFELDSVYGQGPQGSPALYDQSIDDGRTTFLVEAIPGSPAQCRDGSQKFDLPRNSQGTPIMGDPRNDENMVLSQLHVAMLRFHNAMVAKVKAHTGSTNTHEIFTEAQRLVRWHYQWIIVHEFLPKTIGQAMVDDILENGRKFYKWRNAPYIPVEFSVSAYRFGHSQIRSSYRVNFGPVSTGEVFALLFNDNLAVSPIAFDMRGGTRAADRFIDWQTFFDFGSPPPRNNKRIDSKLSSVLFDLPGMPGGEPQSLAGRNLLRHLTFKLPSGQRVAKAMKEEPLTPAELADLAPLHLDDSTPLWFYILKEAELRADGKRLGPVGGRIVGEVFIGVLQGDAMSYLRQEPDWTPTLGSNDQFTIADLLNAAGVVTAL
ncbi:MAG: peroxidase [Methylibium sp.]|uniref:peroxidase family protein n=1 Tax=Methylibium sp. TaxID=2067992 RepID=UPI0018381DBE|nr:heme peroxidase family protein [Methylibium sp.]MBA3597170.1 peroxidase [Methylibium sp.]